MTIDLKVLLRITGLLQTAGDGGTAKLEIDEGITARLATGTGADQANAIFIDDFTIAASGNTTYDLAGSLTDRLGNALVFTAVKAILLFADDGNTNNVVYGNGTNPFVGPFDEGTATMAITPGGGFIVLDPSAAGMAVGAGSADVIKLANSGGSTSVSGTIVIVGEVS